MINYVQVLTVNFSDKEWSISGDDYSGLTWLSDTPKPTQEELDALWEQTKKQIDFVQNRQQAYPSIVDQLDTLYHGGYDAWRAEIQAVKDQFPKP